MKYYLAKTDPDSYSIDDLQNDKETVWDGVHNYQAINVIKTMKKGDIILIYHSIKEQKIVGIAKAISDSYKNDNDERLSWTIKVKFIKKLDEAISLKDIKDSNLFNDWALVRQGRLSTMEVPQNFVKWAKIDKIIN